MATNFPGSVDTFATTSPTNLGDDDAQARNHAERHDDMGAAMNAVQSFALGSAYGVWHLPMVAGSYFAPALTLAAANRAEAYEVGHLIVPQRSCTLDRIAIYVSVAGTSGSVVRLGIRSWSTSTGLPGGVLLDAGTVDTTTTGVKEATISQAVVAGTPYFLSATCQGGASTTPTVVVIGNRAAPASESAPSVATNPNPIVAGGVTGALAESPTWSVTAYSVPRIWVRTSA